MHIDKVRKTTGALAISAFVVGIPIIAQFFFIIYYSILSILAFVSQVYMAIACFASNHYQKQAMTISKYAIIALLFLDVILVGISIWVDFIVIALFDPAYTASSAQVIQILDIIGIALFPILQVAATIFFMKYANMYRVSGGAQAGYIPAPEGVED